MLAYRSIVCMIQLIYSLLFALKSICAVSLFCALIKDALAISFFYLFLFFFLFLSTKCEVEMHAERDSKKKSHLPCTNKSRHNLV